MTDPVAPALMIAALALRGDELLMVRGGPERAAGEWALPGGRLRSGETMAEAVVRLVADQTGYQDGLCGPFMGWGELIDDEAVAEHRVIMYFTAVVMDTDPTGTASADEVRWTPTWRAPELTLADGLAEFLADQEIIDTVV
ncbi:hypothetical protein BH10ACT3_BH10ACT3_09340 [soil metagenome]